MRLSLEMGIPVRRLQREMDAEEFSWYMAYNYIEPIGQEFRADYRNGILCSVLSSVHGVSSAPIDFMPFDKKAEVKQKSDKQLWNVMKLFTVAMGGEVK